jgi:hypothetical protein
MKKSIWIGAGALGVLVVSALGASFYAGTQIEGEMRKFVEETNTEGTLKITEFEHHGSAFSSEGHFLIQVGSGCLGEKAEGDGLLVDYSASHLPTISGPLTLKANAHLNAAAMSVFELASGTDVIAKAQLSPRWIGGMRLDVDSSAFNIPLGAGSFIKVAASQGGYTGSRTSGRYHWTLPSIDLHSSFGNGALSKITIAGDHVDFTRDGQRAEVRFLMADADLGIAKLKGFEISSNVSRHEGVFDLDGTYRFDSLESKLANVSQASLALGMTGLDAATILELDKQVSKNCALQRFDRNTVQLILAALNKLAAKGFSQTLKVNAALPDGKLASTLNLKVQAPQGTANGSFKLSEATLLHFDLEVGKALAEKMGLGSAITQGMVVPTKEGFSSAVDYKARALTINGKSAVGTEFEPMGNMIAEALDGLQSGHGFGGLLGRREEAPVAAAPAAAPVESAADKE